MQMLQKKHTEGKFVCVGLDSDYQKIPEALRHFGVEEAIVKFNQAIIDETGGIVCAYKPNIAFYEAYGNEGFSALQRTIRYIQRVCDVPVILDAKRADIGNTNEGYVREIFDLLNADAVTANPYLGQKALEPFLERKDKGIFLLCRTSNPGAGEFQDLPVSTKGIPEPLYRYVARRIANNWNSNGNCGLVVGATNPEELQQVRRIVGDMPILIPGVGAQGGDAAKTVAAGKDSEGRGMLINSSRGIIFASSGDDFAKAAWRETLKLHQEIINALG